MKITYKSDDKNLSVDKFLELAMQVWPGEYNAELAQRAISSTINITAWDNEALVGCVRVLTDGYFFGTIPEILVLPQYQHMGIGKELMKLAFENSPTSLFFGAQPEAEAFYEKLGYQKSLKSFSKNKPRVGAREKNEHRTEKD
jgi:ribosomal protein S18 acetylase RimI-like enzyme